jgi:ribosomal protein L11 methyltransferase
MKKQPLWQVSVSTSRAAEHAVAALLEDVFGQPPVVYAEEEKPSSTVTVYCSEPREKLEPGSQRLEIGLRLLRASGLDLGQCDILIGKVAREDWTHSWKKYFKTIEVGRALMIRPSWSKRRARAGQAAVVLDPGLSFGTGQHPTTAFCLKQLVSTRKKGQKQSFLDIGTGSGILAIAAAKLRYDPVRGIDNDPTAVRVARANARRNRVDKRLILRCQDLGSMPLASPIRHDLVCANLVADLLVKEAGRISLRVVPGGKLVLAGVLSSQFKEVQQCYEKLGFRLTEAKEENGWKSGALVVSGAAI